MLVSLFFLLIFVPMVAMLINSAHVVNNSIIEVHMKITTVEQARMAVSQLVGHSVKLKCNQGRNRIVTYNGTVAEAHSNVFVVSIVDGIMDRLSCSYSDIICGSVRLLTK